MSIHSRALAGVILLFVFACGVADFSESVRERGLPDSGASGAEDAGSSNSESHDAGLPGRNDAGQPSTPDGGRPGPKDAGQPPTPDAGTPSTAGFPDSTNTGARGTLTVHNGNLTVTTAGAVIQDLEIRGSVMVQADNVRFKNVRVIANDFWPFRNMAKGLVIEDSTLIGGNNSQCSLAGGDWIGRRLDISGAGDGIKMGANSELYDSYIHDLASFDGAHNDGIELTNAPNTKVVHNTVLNANGQTSAIMLSDYGSNPNTNVLVENNLFAGGGFTLYGGAPDTAAGHRVINNQFSTRYFSRSGSYGPVAYWQSAGNTWSGNIWADGPNKGSPLP